MNHSVYRVLLYTQNTFISITTPDLPKGDLIKIGRLIAHTDLGQYCMIRPILFKGEVSRELIQPENNEKIIQEQMNNKIPKKKGRCR